MWGVFGDRAHDVQVLLAAGELSLVELVDEFGRFLLPHVAQHDFQVYFEVALDLVQSGEVGVLESRLGVLLRHAKTEILDEADQGFVGAGVLEVVEDFGESVDCF